MDNEMPGSARNILRRYLEELEEKELKTFTFLLEDYTVKEGYSKIPRGRLENADRFTIADQMINHYSDEYALEIAGNVLYNIPRRDLYDKFKCDFLKHMDMNPKLQNTTVSHPKENSMQRVKEKLRPFEDKPALLQWIKEEMKQDFSSINNERMKRFHCLYEIHDEEFVKSATEHVKHIGVSKVSLGRAMTAMDFRALGFCLQNCPGVERVGLGAIEVKPEDLRAVTPGLMNCSVLTMESCSLTTSCCGDLATVLRTNCSLTQLDLRENKLMDSGVIALCAGLKHPQCKIQKLVLQHCSLTASCCTDLASVLTTNSSLTDLDLSMNELMDSGVLELCAALKHPGCKIQALWLWDCSLTASCCSHLSSVVTTNSSLTWLDLSKNNKLMDSGVVALCEGLRHPDCRIQALWLGNCSLTASCCAHLSSVVTTSSSLTKLHLSDNKLMDLGVIALCEGLRHPSCWIQALHLQRCSLTASCCAYVTSVLRINSSLTELYLSGNNLMDS